MYENGIDFAEQVLITLDEMEVSTSEESELIFYLYVPTEKDAQVCQGKLTEAGFDCDIEKSADEESNDWLCYCTKELVPTKKSLAEIGEFFMKLATDFNGEFDGWETALNNAFELSMDHMFLEPTIRDLANSVLEGIKDNMVYPHDLIPCNAKDFENIDLAFYESTENKLASSGFKTVADIEDKTISNQNAAIPIITFARSMWHNEHKIMATFFYIEPLEIGFTDFVSVTEAEKIIHSTTTPSENEITNYPKIDSEFLSLDTDIDEMLNKHIHRVNQLVGSNSDTRLIDIDTTDKVINITNLAYKIKSKHLESIGWVTKEYLVAQTGGDEVYADNLLAEIKTILAEEQAS